MILVDTSVHEGRAGILKRRQASFIERSQELYRKGASLWTYDRNLNGLAKRFDISYEY